MENGSWGRFYGGKEDGTQRRESACEREKKGGNGAFQESETGRERERERLAAKILQKEMSLGLDETETLALCSTICSLPRPLGSSEVASPSFSQLAPSFPALRVGVSPPCVPDGTSYSIFPERSLQRPDHRSWTRTGCSGSSLHGRLRRLYDTHGDG